MNPNLIKLCNFASFWIYENLTKILRTREDGGNTCFGLTIKMHNELKSLGYSPKLLLGHKKNIRNVHCALTILEDGVEYFLDPGYLIFDPLPVPPEIPNLNKKFYPLKPNWVVLERENNSVLLYTGNGQENPKFRFYFPLQEVSMSEFYNAWDSSYSGESMRHLVFNKLDKSSATQFYYQSGKLTIRSETQSFQQKIPPSERITLLSQTFGINRELLELGEKLIIERN